VNSGRTRREKRRLRLRRFAGFALDGTIGHKALESLHGAALAAEMTHLGVAALGKIPRQKSEALAGLSFVETGDIAEHEHPPVVGFTFLLAADVAGEGYVPDHGYSF